VASRRQSLPRDFWVLWSLYLCNRASTFVVPLLGIYAIEVLDASVAFSGFLLTVVGIGTIGANWIGGRLVEVAGPRFVYVLGMSLSAIAVFAVYLARNDLVLVGCCFLLGLATEMFRPASATMVAHVTDPEQHTWAYSVMLWAGNVGYGVAALSGGFLSEIDFRIVFITEAVLCSTIAIVGRVMLSSIGAGPAIRRDRSSYREALSNRPFVWFLFSWLFYGFVFAQYATVFPVSLKILGMPNHVIGAVISINAVLVVCFQPLAGSYARRIAHRHIMTAGVLVTAGAMVTLTLGHGLAVICLGVALWTFGEILVSAVNQTFIVRFAAGRSPGSYFGTFGVVYAAAFTFGPLLGALALDGSRTYLWIACATACCLSAISFRWSGALKEQTAPRRSAIESAAS
jgi:MFS family permease